MSHRLDPRPLFVALRNNLRRRDTQAQPADRLTWLVLSAAAIVTPVVSIFFRLRVENAENLLAVFGLLAGVMIAGFTQLAAWRSQLSRRSATYQDAERTGRQAVDEAVEGTLVTAVLSVAAAFLSVAASALHGVTWFHHALPIAATALLLAVTAVIGVLFLIIVNLLWDGYRRSVRVDEDESRRRKQERDSHWA